MFEKISSDIMIGKSCPYSFADVKASGFDNISLFGANSNSITSVKKEESPKTKDKQLYDVWKNANPKLTPAFFKEVVNISKEVKCDPEDLVALMYGESELNPKKTSGNKKYHGLIQFYEPSLKAAIKDAIKEGRAEGLKKDITVEKLKKLSAEQQLPYVKAYLILFKEYCGRGNKKLSGGELWGMIKSPKLTKQKNAKFFRRLEKELDNIKKSMLKYETPFHVEKKRN